MALVVHDTRTRRKEPFVPAHPKVVRIYTCGLTVYAPMHIGHARTYCFWDTFRRYLEYSGYHGVSVINYTDIDDRIIAQGADGKGCVDLAERVIAGFRRDCRALHIKDYAAYTRATDFVEEQVDMVSRLVDKGHAYLKDGEVFYARWWTSCSRCARRPERRRISPRETRSGSCSPRPAWRSRTRRRGRGGP